MQAKNANSLQIQSLTAQESAVILELESLSKTLVWYTPSQIERGDNLRSEEDKGIRPWSIPHSTGEFLYNLVQEKNAKIIVELGTSIGYSTLWLGLALRKIESKQNGGVEIFTVEKNPEKIEIAKKYFAKSEIKSLVKLYEEEIDSALPKIISAMQAIQSGAENVLQKHADIIFFDADRSNYAKYLETLSPIIGPSTLLIVDNAIDMRKRLEPFKKHLDSNGWKTELVTVGDGLWLCQK